MHSVLICVQNDHDHSLLCLAVFVCVVGVYATFALSSHARRSEEGERRFWRRVSILAGGCTAVGDTLRRPARVPASYAGRLRTADDGCVPDRRRPRDRHRRFHRDQDPPIQHEVPGRRHHRRKHCRSALSRSGSLRRPRQRPLGSGIGDPLGGLERGDVRSGLGHGRRELPQGARVGGSDHAAVHRHPALLRDGRDDDELRPFGSTSG